jgi:hypothetical protein
VADFYSDKVVKADTMLRKYGTTMLLRDKTAGETFDPVTGAVSGAVPVSYPVVGVKFPIKLSARKGSPAEDRKQYTVHISALNLPVVPGLKHELVIGGVGYDIVDVDILQPADVVVMYTLRVAL